MFVVSEHDSLSLKGCSNTSRLKPSTLFFGFKFTAIEPLPPTRRLLVPMFSNTVTAFYSESGTNDSRTSENAFPRALWSWKLLTSTERRTSAHNSSAKMMLWVANVNCATNSSSFIIVFKAIWADGASLGFSRGKNSRVNSKLINSAQWVSGKIVTHELILCIHDITNIFYFSIEIVHVKHNKRA